MRASRRLVSYFLLIAGSAMISANGAAETLLEKQGRGGFGIKVGFINGGTIYYHGKAVDVDGDISTVGSYSLGVLFEYPVSTTIRPQLCIDIHDLSQSSRLPVEDKNQKLMHLSAACRYAFYSPDRRLAVRPGLSLGYGYLARVGIFEPTNHLVLVGSSEVIFYPSTGAGFLMELGLLWGLKGGNKEWDIHGGPLLLFRAGLLL